MILEYGVRNFLSFREGAVVPFRLDGHVPDEVKQGRDAATIMCVKGANGSGKTHLLKGLAFVCHFISKSFSEEVESDIYIEPFGKSSDNVCFYVEFKIEGDIYRYELEATQQHVMKEALYRTRKRKVPLFERVGNELSYVIGSLTSLRSVKLRSNASVISIARQHEVDELRHISDYFASAAYNVTSIGYRNGPVADEEKISEFLSTYPQHLGALVDFLRSCDTGVSDIRIASEERSTGKGKKFYPIFLHESQGEIIEVRPHAESSGTKQLFRNFIGYMHAVAQGTLLIMDEFDLYLHPFLLPRILDLFTDDQVNDRGAQLLFSTHDTDILDLCGKYRTCFVQKHDNASFVYRLDDVPGDMLRNDRPISPHYRDGKIGGVPKL